MNTKSGDTAVNADDSPVWSTPDRLAGQCAAALARAETLREEIKAGAGSGRSADDTLAAFNAMLEAIDSAGGWAALMFQVHPEETVRDAAKKCRQDISGFTSGANLDRGLYDALFAVDTSGLDALGKRFVEHLLRDFRRSGVDKDDATRARLDAINERMVELGQSFSTNVRSDVKSIAVDPKRLAGLPDDYIAAHPAGDNGLATITTDYPDLFPIQTYCEDADLRRDLYGLFMSRGYPANVDVLKELLELRHEYAGILGHPHWASYNAEDKMVRSSDAIEAFIKQVAKIARPRAKADLKTLLRAKKKDDRKARRIEVWDRFFYVSKVREAEHDFDARAVRPYFPYAQVRAGILALYGELFSLRFEQLTDEPTWHPDIEAFAVFEGDAEIARFYLDMHPRADKYKHAAMFPVRTGLSTGTRPLASLVCNFPNPTDGDGKALMEHSDVVTFFHEFGHLIHQLLAQRGPWVTLAGINVEWDFVEAPSQILEEWAWDADVLSRFGKHVDTGEVISADLVARMRAADEFGKGVHVMRQVFYSAFSYFLHARDPAALDLSAYADEMYEDYSPYPRMGGDHVYANFGHLVGYSSMYYTYQWSLVIAKDLFTRFAGAGLMDQQVAREYRESILLPGGTADAADLVQEFLGRPSNLDAYKAWLQD